jgi:hypothetical protein
MRTETEEPRAVSVTTARLIFLGGFLLFAAIIAAGMAMAGADFAMPSPGRDAQLLLMGIGGVVLLFVVLHRAYGAREQGGIEEEGDAPAPPVRHWAEQRTPQRPAVAEQALNELRHSNNVLRQGNDELTLANGLLRDQLSQARAAHRDELENLKREQRAALEQAAQQAAARHEADLEREISAMRARFRTEVERAVQQKSAELEQRLATQARELAMLKPVAENARALAAERDELKRQLAEVQQGREVLLAKLAELEAEPQQTASWREGWLIIGKMIAGASTRPTLALRPTRDWLRELGGGIGKSEEEWTAFKAFVHLLASTSSTHIPGEGEPSSPTNKTAPIAPISTLEIPIAPQESAGEEGQKAVDTPVVDGGRSSETVGGRSLEQAVDAVVDAPASVRERLERARGRKPSMFSGYRARSRGKRA